jgi:hypothetical protein|tara:strand:- start:181 stop:294 length:114 start_codon:yes stop_codon:yes gene_type:complete
MTFEALVNLLKVKEKSSQQQSKNKERNKVLRKRVKNG